VCIALMLFFDNILIVGVWNTCSYICYGFVRRVLARSGSIGKLPFWSEAHFGPVVYLTAVPIVLIWSVRWAFAKARG